MPATNPRYAKDTATAAQRRAVLARKTRNQLRGVLAAVFLTLILAFVILTAGCAGPGRVTLPPVSVLPGVTVSATAGVDLATVSADASAAAEADGIAGFCGLLRLVGLDSLIPVPFCTVGP